MPCRAGFAVPSRAVPRWKSGKQVLFAHAVPCRAGFAVSSRAVPRHGEEQLRTPAADVWKRRGKSSEGRLEVQLLRLMDHIK